MAANCRSTPDGWLTVSSSTVQTQRRPIRPIRATTATPKATKAKRAQRRVLMRSNDPFEVLMSRRTSHVCYTDMIGDDP
jgi:hypothetical protein